MAENNESKNKCISVFKNGKNNITTQLYTEVILKLINTLEKNKNSILLKRYD